MDLALTRLRFVHALSRIPDVALDELTFQVKGSSAEPYELTFITDGDSLTALCTCPAGQYGNLGKPRIGILAGNSKGFLRANHARVYTVVSLLQDTDVAAALTEFRVIEASNESSKNALMAAKRKLAKAMNS